MNNHKLKTQFYLRAPIWNGGNRCVGLAEGRLNGTITTFEIMYEDKHGQRIYPHQFKVSTKEVMRGKVQFIQGIKVRIVPLDKCEEVFGNNG